MALPNGPMEIVFSFDTTGSMSGCLNEVRGRVSDMVQRLQADIPGIKMAVFAHGDYCDRHNYITKFVDFTDDVAKLVDFTQNVKSTGGGDSDECYELVLYEVRTKLSWTPGSQRALVMIGDCNPHEPNYPDNKLKLDWRVEADELGKMGVRIYSVQCHSYNAEKFYSEIAKRTDGRHLKLSDFKNIFDFLMTVCYRERGDDLFLSYEKEVRARSTNISKDLHQLFGDLRDRGPGSATSDTSSADSKTTVKKVGKGGKAVPKILELKKATKPVLKCIKKPPTGTTKKKPVPANKKYLEKYLPKLRRENVPDTNFLLRAMPWSKWQLVVSPKQKIVMDAPKQMASNISYPRKGSGSGYRAKQIFGGKTKVPAIYEVAVQTKSHARKYVTYSKVCRGFTTTTSMNWENKLFGRKDIKAQVDSVVEKDCSVFVRRLLLKNDKAKDQVKQAFRRYDYAWKGLRSVRDGHRTVSKGDTEISCEMEM